VQNKYDVIVIGAGPAGVNAATQLSNAGFSVLVVSEYIGGGYCFSGSIMSNTALYLSYLYNKFKTRTVNFIDIPEEAVKAPFDFKKSRKYVENISSKIVKAFTDQLSEAGSEFFQGIAKFVSKDKVEIQSRRTGEKHDVEFDKCIVATGSYNPPLEIPSTKKFLYANNIFNLQSVPASVVVIGGGFVGCEYATFFRRLGCDVHIVEKTDRILSTFDPQVTKRLEESFKRNGIKVKKNSKITNVEKVGNKSILFLDDDKMEAEEIFVAIGRKPAVNNLSLENAGVEMDKSGVILDSCFRTTNKNIYLVGDAAGKAMLVNWAYKSSTFVVKHISGVQRKFKYEFMPKVLYIDPEVSSVGFTEQEARRKGFSPLTVKYTYTNLEKSLIIGFNKGLVKVIYDRETKKILGAHIFGKGASELVTAFTLLIQSGIKIDRISEYIFNHPTFAEVLNELGNKVKTKGGK